MVRPLYITTRLPVEVMRGPHHLSVTRILPISRVRELLAAHPATTLPDVDAACRHRLWCDHALSIAPPVLDGIPSLPGESTFLIYGPEGGFTLVELIPSAPSEHPVIGSRRRILLETWDLEAAPSRCSLTEMAYLGPDGAVTPEPFPIDPLMRSR